MPSNLEDFAVELRRRLGLVTGIFIIVADMIGSCCAGVAVLLGIPAFLVRERITRKGHRSREETVLS